MSSINRDNISLSSYDSNYIKNWFFRVDFNNFYNEFYNSISEIFVDIISKEYDKIKWNYLRRKFSDYKHNIVFLKPKAKSLYYIVKVWSFCLF